MVDPVTARVPDLPDATLPLDYTSDLLWTVQYDGAAWRDRKVTIDGMLEPYITTAEALNAFTAALYGGLKLTGTNASFANIGATWGTIDVFDAVEFAAPRGVIQNLTNGSLTLETAGVFQLNVVLSLSHNESNGGRQTGVRLYNLTDAAPTGDGVQVFIGRNQPGTTAGFSIVFDVTEAAVGKEIVLQIGGGDSLSAVEFDSAAYSLVSVGEFRGTLSGG